MFGKFFGRWFITAIALLCGTTVGGRESFGNEPTNVVLIMLDDVGYSDYGCFGGEIQTPNIDSLARDGIRFTQFYNNAVCVPTRASLLTGLFPRYIGERPRIQLTDQMITVAEVLKQAGYHTTLSGKWHLGRVAPHRPIDRGFDEFFGMLDGCSNHFDPNIPDPPFEGGAVRVWSQNENRVTKFPKDFYSTDAITDHAIENIRRNVTKRRPFFAHICYTAAHSPLHAKPADIAKYHGKYGMGWDELRKIRQQRQIEKGIVPASWGTSSREPEVTAWEQERNKAWSENLMAVYAAMIDCVDQNIGRILKTLEETGATKNTVVMVLNDNGGCPEQAGGDDLQNIAGSKDFYVSCGAGWAYAQNTPFRRFKGWVHEGGISTPLIVRWPGIVQPGTKSDRVGHVVDLLPTITDIVGATVPSIFRGQQQLPIEGKSFANALRGETTDRDTPIFWKAFDNRAVRDGRWKLVRDQTVGAWELYDVSQDRIELNNLANQHPERVREMEAAWNRWAEKTGANKTLATTYHLTRKPKHEKPIKIAMIGDSTMASYPNPPADRPTLTGWGQVFSLFFNSNVTVLNHARSGASSKSFRRDGRWDPVLREKPDYLFIQFGHNDQPNKGDRATDANGDFQTNLKQYIAEATAAGCQPVLVTPVARRIFVNGRATTSLTPYVEATLKVAIETKTPVIDLHAASLALFDELGDEQSSFMSPSIADRSHFSRAGAKQIARLVSQMVSRSVPKLQDYQRQPWQIAE